MRSTAGDRSVALPRGCGMSLIRVVGLYHQRFASPASAGPDPT